MRAMTSRERICAAMRREDVDYLPCSIYFNSNLKVPGYDCVRRDERTRLALDLGVDPFVGFGPGRAWSPDVKASNWVENVGGEPYPILWQAWDTPEGRLTQAVRKDAACADWREIHWGDRSASSLYKPLIETPEDVARFGHLFSPATEDQLERLGLAHRASLDAARRQGIPTVFTYGAGLANLMFTMGAERAVLFAMDYPEAFDELAEIVHRAEMRNIEYAGRMRFDILKRFGGYEQTNFYNPKIFRAVCAPRLKAEVEYAHSLGLLVFYRVVTGMEPLLDDIAEIGFDCIEGGEPRLSNCSLEMWRRAFAAEAASWTGVSTPVLLGGGDPEAVRREVRRCVDVFGRRGFILGVTNSIRNHFPWPNTLAMVAEWKKVR